jgi:hypothetical protein
VNWPLETVKLIDPAEYPVDDWIGYLVPHYLGGLANQNSQCPFVLEFECGLRWLVKPGDLEQCVWDALVVHEHWCKET